MGQQQILLLVAAVILVGAAIAVGIVMFGGQNASANKDAIIQDLTNLGSDAFGYCRKPTIMGGGSGSFLGYAISDKSGWGSGNPNAVYTITTQTMTQITFSAASKMVEGATVMETYDNFNNLISGPTAIGF